MQFKTLSLAAAAAGLASALPAVSTTRVSSSATSTATGSAIKSVESSLAGVSGVAGLAGGLLSGLTGGSSSKGTVVYWGQNDEDPELGSLCTTSSNNVDTVVVAFVNKYGNGTSIGANFGKWCSLPGDCSAIETGINTCKQAGKKVYVSIGGWENEGTLSSTADAQGVANALWGAFGNPAVATVSGATRAFGSAFVDGFDFDLEHSGDPSLPYYPALIEQLRSNFAKDTSNSYSISGSPMCSLTSAVMSSMIHAAKFDQLWPQFYNDVCSASGSEFNLDSLPGDLASGASAGAKIWVGLPASSTAASGSSSGAQYYLAPPQLTTFLNKYKSDSNFQGVMLWSAGQAQTNVANNCNYMQQISNILSKGSAC